MKNIEIDSFLVKEKL